MPVLTAKSSTIFIATERGTQIFRSLGDIPQPLRRRLHESTHSVTAATILIADKKGREELVRALQGEPSHVQCRLAEAIRARSRRVEPKPVLKTADGGAGRLRKWLEFLIPVMIGASLLLLVDSHF